jgi:L-lactate dehydrogenase complex protein LldG
VSTAREAILEGVRKGRRSTQPSSYVLPAWSGDARALFLASARTSAAVVHEIATFEDAPAAIWAILNAANARPRLHIPSASPLNELPWQRAPGLTLAHEAPSGSDSAVSRADYGIAETGTLVFLSGARTPSSWHFLPGSEIALLHRDDILPRLEDVIARLGKMGTMPATVNLVTGPSRTADIEQAIERGAHGPRDVHILVVG